MEIRCVWEHNGEDSLLYAENCAGAFTRGRTVEEALQKMPDEINSYYAWLGKTAPKEVQTTIVQEKTSELDIKDADSEVLFDAEEKPLTMEEYLTLKRLAMKSAEDFLKLYESIPDKAASVLPMRKTFLGIAPRTAEEMYLHTKSVNSYYFGEVGVDVDSNGTIVECRRRGFEALEKNAEFLSNPVKEGSFGELWSVRKVLRRFLWHDRIHAKAMWRMAGKTFQDCELENVFRF